MKSKLLQPKKDSQFWQDVVSVDVFCHDAQVLADVREALEAGLRPKAFELVEQEDGYAVVLRLEREESRPKKSRKHTTAGTTSPTATASS